MSRRRLIPLSIALFSCVWLGAFAAPTPQRTIVDLDRILAVINDDVITQSELNARLAHTKRQLAAEKIRAPSEDVLRRQLLERMIVERLQLQLAERAGIRVADADVERAIENIARSNKMGLAEFRRMLEREGIDPSAHAEDIRVQLVLRQLVDREINSRIAVAESEVEAFLAANPRGTDTEFNLSHIFLPLPEAAGPDAIQSMRRRADEILRRLKDGAEFEQLAVSFSQGEAAMSGGVIGWRQAGQLPEMFLDALKGLAPGQVSEVLRGPNGFHILKLNGRRGETGSDVTQTQVRHILLRRSEIQSLDEARVKLLNLRERIVHGEDFATLARAHSEDTGSASGGGSLGWTNPGQLVPEFEQAMNALKPGEVSQPVTTAFGLHLIQVLARRTQDVGEERQEARARQQIHARKAGERYEQWVRQLRDEAYVEYVTGDE
jgi:peptidyl-prolyl cis-trans isomerase SurA